MDLFAKFCGHRSYGNEDINFIINSYMNHLEKAVLTASIRHIERISKTGIPIHNYEVPDTDDRKTTRTHAIEKDYVTT